MKGWIWGRASFQYYGIRTPIIFFVALLYLSPRRITPCEQWFTTKIHDLGSQVTGSRPTQRSLKLSPSVWTIWNLQYPTCHLSTAQCQPRNNSQSTNANFQPKSSASGNALSNNLPRDWQSPALNNAKTIFHWHRSSGVGRPECSWNSNRWSYWHLDHRRYQSKHHGFNVILRRENFIYRKSNLISKMRKILSFYEVELFIYHHSPLLPKITSVGKRPPKRSYGFSTRIQAVKSH